MTRSFIFPSVAACVALTAACVSPAPPRALIAQADQAVHSAEQQPAVGHSAVELRMARDKLQAARRYMTEGEYELAANEAEQALVDAQLAAAKARNRQAEQATEEMRETLNALEEEIQND